MNLSIYLTNIIFKWPIIKDFVFDYVNFYVFSFHTIIFINISNHL